MANTLRLKNMSAIFGSNRSSHIILGVVLCGLANIATANTISFGGYITQSTVDGTGPAVNNPTLNNVLDLQPYVVTLASSGPITGPGTYDLTGASLVFSDPTAPATESSFGPISLTITQNGGFDEFSLLGCLTTGSGCLSGNQLDANFKILASMFNGQNVGAIGLDQPHPLDLLEDDGTTDIQGSIITYSITNGRGSTVPEPSMTRLMAFLSLVSAAGWLMKRKKSGTVVNRF